MIGASPTGNFGNVSKVKFFLSPRILGESSRSALLGPSCSGTLSNSIVFEPSSLHTIRFRTRRSLPAGALNIRLSGYPIMALCLARRVPGIAARIRPTALSGHARGFATLRSKAFSSIRSDWPHAARQLRAFTNVSATWNQT